MGRKGQGAVEYLLIIGAAVVVAAIVIAVIVGIGSSANPKPEEVTSELDKLKCFESCSYDSPTSDSNCEVINPVSCKGNVPGSCGSSCSGGPQTLNPLSTNVSAGCYDATALNTVDPDLVVGNIKSGVNIFGVDGSLVEGGSCSYDGNAVVDKVLSGYSFYGNSSTLLHGSLPTQYLSPSSAVLSAGYYDANTLSTVDPDLRASRIKLGTSIFGFNGSFYQTMTGQTGCWDTGGAPRSCSGTGEDGNIYGASYARVWRVNSDNFTLSDLSSGLMWQKGSSGSTVTWQGALDYCNNLSLAGYDDWHLPTKIEIGLIYDNQTGTCYSGFTGCIFYWSSTSVPSSPGSAFRLYSSNGGTLGFGSKSDGGTYGARCVRLEN
ncbi:MAG: DUF1566 domain-containing protein [Candidatus Diapherotrites archaeon]|nr:DUF1566 domain-containing protein [Candidatus Diapherotrites archaeon]